MLKKKKKKKKKKQYLKYKIYRNISNNSYHIN